MYLRARQVLNGVLVLVLLFALMPVWPATARPAERQLLLPPWFVASQVPPDPQLDPALLRALSAPGDAPVRVVVLLRTSPGRASLMAVLGKIDDPLTARRMLVSGLQAQMQHSLAPLEPLLSAAKVEGDLLSKRDLWIVNGVALTARQSLIQQLAASPDVAEVRLDRKRTYLDADTSPDTVQALQVDRQTITWGVQELRAPEVWETLAISGTGTVVASVDTGVDWLHPDLYVNYKGNLGRGMVNHSGTWFDAVSGGTYPYDDDGHGSHTVGTAVGQHGIGVAPGARWIGVKVLDNNGTGFDSDIHAGFQWLLAPEGNPALAPDVVICSWGSANSGNTVFQEDIAALFAAGIFPVFSAGNEGPERASLRSPASLPGVFAVGASDPYGGVASFSSRGPSPWNEIKPYVVAPGVDIYSSMPGGTYALKNGTSMAAPHVAGVAALMRGISTTLPAATLAQVMTETAVPLSVTVPNNDSGWGRVDAYAAVMAVAHPGVVSGTVDSASGVRIADATVVAVPHGEGCRPAQASTDASGGYRLALVPATYDLTASAFGYAAQTRSRVYVVTDAVHSVDFTLIPLPAGSLEGRITVSPTGALVTDAVVIQVIGAPPTTTVDAAGQYALSLPAGSYTVEVRGRGYRVARARVTVSESTTVQDFQLDPAPTLLFVDEGVWYYESMAPYWRAALDDLGYVYDEVLIKSAPVATDSLDLSYDVVLWSSPAGSPGLVGAGSVLTDYLEAGGRLLLSGQDIGFFDSGTGIFVFPQQYLLDHLGVRYLDDNAPSRVLTGTGPFEGLTIAIAGGDGADNQRLPDEVAVNDLDRAELVWHYVDGRGGGVGTHICTPYRALFFSFGYEAIADAATRREVMARSLDWLVEPSPLSGLTLTYEEGPRIGLPGEQITHVVRVRHVGSAGPSDTVQVTLSGNRWPARVQPGTATLTPCASQYFTVTVTIPPDAAVNETDMMSLVVSSSLLTEPLTKTLQSKTPAPLLLVDDDRWYDVEEKYQEALGTVGIPYDVWNTDLSSGLPNTGQIITDTLLRYPLLLWFTGYDWYAPVTEVEEGALLHYLDAGGRLLLSGQDFLAQELRPLAQRMGVADWSFDQQIEVAMGVTEHPAGGWWGPVTLDYPFRNWGDVVEPDREAEIIARGVLGQPVALGAEGGLTEAWRTLFYAFPVESLPLPQRTEALAHGLGWLSPVGQSTWRITPTTPLLGSYVTATLVLENDDLEIFSTVVSHSVPAELVVTEMHSPGLVYTPETRLLSWRGLLPPAEPVTLSWVTRVTDTAAWGQAITPVVTIALPAWDFAFSREAALRVGGADLSMSAWNIASDQVLPCRAASTLSLTVQNRGPGEASNSAVQIWMVAGLAPITATLQPTLGTSLLLWQGSLAPGQSLPLTFSVRPWAWTVPLRVDALLSDGTGMRWERRAWLRSLPEQRYMPVVYKGFAEP